MSAEHVITRKAADGTLTIAELREFLEEFDKAADRPALKNGHGLRPSARVSFRGGIKSITVTIPGGEQK